MTDNTKKANNLFDFATSELSQDAFFCWSLNWLAVKEDTEDPYYKYGKAMLDLFLGEHKKDIYKEVKVKKQFNKIDVLVLFKDNQDNQYALIIEDKTNTSEHNEQIKKYKEKLNEALSKNQDIGYENLPGNQIYTAYVKTGIMYSQDLFMKNTVNTVVAFDRIYGLLEEYCKEQKGMISSDISLDYYHYLKEINDKHCRIEEMIDEYNYVEALKTEYGRYCFLKKIFYEENGKMDLNCKDKTDEADMYVETIKSGNNNGKVPYAQYTIWHAKHTDKIAETRQDEYYSMFWRIDNATENKTISPYLALRYYDKNAKNIFDDLKKYATNKFIETSKIKDKVIFSKKESRKGSVERNLLYIRIRNLDGISLSEISKVLHDINSKLTTYCKTEFENIK